MKKWIKSGVMKIEPNKIYINNTLFTQKQLSKQFKMSENMIHKIVFQIKQDMKNNMDVYAELQAALNPKSLYYQDKKDLLEQFLKVVIDKLESFFKLDDWEKV